MLTNGTIVDKLGGKRAVLIGALGTGVINALSAVLFATRDHTIYLLAFFNVLNNIFQPFGSLCVVKINSNWYDSKERGVFSGVFGVMIGFGYFLALVMGGLILETMPFFMIFLKPAILLAVGSIIVHVYVVDSPPIDPGALDGGEPLALDSAAAAAAASGGSSSSGTYPTKKPSSFQSFSNKILTVLAIPSLRVLVLAMICVGWVREGFLSWFTSFLEDEVGIDVGSSLYTVAASGITIGGMLGSLGGGFVSDRFFNSARAPVVAILFVIQSVLLFFLSFAAEENPAFTIACTTLVASCLFGTLTLIIGSASSDYAGKAAAGTASGILNFFQYASSSASSFFTGLVVQKFGWSAWTVCLLPASITGALCMFYLMRLQTKGSGGGTQTKKTPTGYAAVGDENNFGNHIALTEAVVVQTDEKQT